MIDNDSENKEFLGDNDVALGGISAIELYGMSEEELMIETRKKLFHKDADVIEVYNFLLPFLYSAKSVYTLRNRYGNVRKEIANSNISESRKKEYLNIFKLDNIFYKYIDKMQDKARDEKRASINNKYLSIDNYLSGLAKIKDMINNENNYKYVFNELLKQNGRTTPLIRANISAIYVLLNSGRRTFEVFSTLEIDRTKIDNDAEKTIIYQHLAKKRNTGNYQAFLIDNDYDSMKKAIRNIRNYYNDKLQDIDSKKFNNSYSKNLNNFIKKFIKNYDILNIEENFTLKDTRDMYLEVALYKYKQVIPVAPEKLKKLILGHEISYKADSSVSYGKFQISDNKAIDIGKNIDIDNIFQNEYEKLQKNETRELSALEKLTQKNS